jgi:hypothetical protein
MKNCNTAGIALRLLGYALMAVASLVGGSLLFAFNPQSGNLGTWLKIALVFALGTLVSRAGHKYYKMGTKLSSPSAEDSIAKDPRPPVVYLRSFLDDSLASREEPRFEMAGGALVESWFSPTEEQELAKIMNQIGPFIAIGNPSEELPELGAARTYVSGAEWKDKVLGWISRAKLVVLRAGTTRGFWWEAETVAKNVKPERIIFLLPLTATEYQTFRKRAETFLPCRLPDYPRKKRCIGSIRGILLFQSDWTPHFLELRGIGSGWTGALKMTLEPVFKQLGVAWKKPWQVYAYTIRMVFVFLVFAVIIAFLVDALLDRSLVLGW